jgi:glycosyltransferase involved in cell wall biosynthesis
MTPDVPGELTVVVPVRNGAAFLHDCLASLLAERAAEIVVVDGCSTDGTLRILEKYPVRVLSDGGRGVAAARLLGAQAAQTPWIALVDVDVVVEPGDLAALLAEAVNGGYTALQAGLESTSGPGYWGRALVQHHRTGRSRYWFGLAATVFDREAFLRVGLDETFMSGEDIELRLRMERDGARFGVSSRTVVSHRFGDTFDFARSQFLADGAGLARTALKHGWRAAPLLALPSAAAARGAALSVMRRQPQWIPYYGAFLAFNWLGMARQLTGTIVKRGDQAHGTPNH